MELLIKDQDKIMKVTLPQDIVNKAISNFDLYMEEKDKTDLEKMMLTTIKSLHSHLEVRK